MVDSDSGQRTTLLVGALWRVPWIWCWSMQPAIVWFGGARPHRPPQRLPRHCAHTLMEVAGPPVCGARTTANVGEATCAMGWP